MDSTDRADYMKTFRALKRAEGVRRVSVTLSGIEYARLLESASRHDVQPTAHLKQLAVAHLDEKYLVPADLASKLAALTAIFRGIGTNLNQLARHSNEMKAFMDTNEVRLQLRRMEEELRAVVTKPPRTSSGKS